MKHIILFEKFGNSDEGVSIMKSFDKFTAPERPFKRELTNEETRKMFKHFRNNSWSNVDKNGKIVLGGGESEMGRYYITEEDLEKLS